MNPLTRHIKKALRDEKNQTKANEMRRYMKSEMPFHGVPAPAQKKIFTALFRQHPLFDQNTWHAAVLDLWRDAEFREERYASIALTGVKKYRSFQTMESLAMYEEMIITGAWWDIIDSLSNRLGELLLSYKKPMTSKMDRWARDKNMWKRRSSILCQLKLKKDTDIDLLFENIRINMSDGEFFIRKAIGWALREYSKTSPEDVIRFVRDCSAELSPLSKKEGLRVLIKQGLLDSVPG